MASYPALPFTLQSQQELLDDLQTDRAVNGGIRQRAFYTAVKLRLVLNHQLGSAEYATLSAFYAAWRAGTSPFSAARQTFSVTWRGASYAMTFAAPPKTVGNTSPSLREVTVELLEA